MNHGGMLDFDSCLIWTPDVVGLQTLDGTSVRSYLHLHLHVCDVITEV